MTRAALDIVLNDPERYVLTEEERSAYERLAVFFGSAAVDPARFPLSPKQASRIKAVVKKTRGPAQPQSRRNKRKARQERRISFAKKRRKQNREFREAYNEAMAKMAAEREEMEAAYREVEARVAAEPKFDIVDGQGNLIMSSVPQSAFRPQETGLDETSPQGTPGAVPGVEASKIILPGSAEALGL